MARRYRKKGRRSSKMSIPVSIALPLAAMAWRGYKQISTGDLGGLSRDFTGFDVTNNTMNLSNLVPTYGPLLAGAMVHKVAGMTGVNRAIGRAKIPLIRV